MKGAEIHTKVRAEHLERSAYVYVRQSSVYQVEHNLESQRRQYGLAKWAGELGWPEERIVVVDEDQGRSGASAGSRSGRRRAWFRYSAASSIISPSVVIAFGSLTLPTSWTGTRCGA